MLTLHLKCTAVTPFTIDKISVEVKRVPAADTLPALCNYYILYAPLDLKPILSIFDYSM